LAQSCEDGHHSLVTLERVLSEYNEDSIFDFDKILLISAKWFRGALQAPPVESEAELRKAKHF